MAHLEACLFDLDGVIVDTAQFHYTAWRKIANDLGFDLTNEQNEQLKGVSRMESLERILTIGGIVLDDHAKLALATRKNAHYLDLCQHMSIEDVLPGVQVFMDSLVHSSIKLGLGSASKNARLILKQIGMMEYFDAIVDGNRITKGKPDPETFLLGATDLHVAPGNCVVFEDAVAGIQAAKAAGMIAIGVGSPSVLHQADLVINGFQDIDFSTLMSRFAREEGK